MRSLAAAVLLISACGGGAQRTATEPATPGPVTTPEQDPAVGRLVPPAAGGAQARAATMSSLPAEGSGDRDEDDWMTRGTPGPRFSDAPLPAMTPQPPARGCDPEKFVTEGKDKLAMGMDAQALAAFEKALVCVHDPVLERYAVLAACRGKLFSRARAHFIRLAEADRPKLAEICQGPHF